MFEFMKKKVIAKLPEELPEDVVRRKEAEAVNRREFLEKARRAAAKEMLSQIRQLAERNGNKFTAEITAEIKDRPRIVTTVKNYLGLRTYIDVESRLDDVSYEIGNLYYEKGDDYFVHGCPTYHKTAREAIIAFASRARDGRYIP